MLRLFLVYKQKCKGKNIKLKQLIGSSEVEGRNQKRVQTT